MDNIQQIVLTIGLVFVCAFSMKVSQEAMNTMTQMNHQIQLMFVKG